MKLNYRLRSLKDTQHFYPIILIHGLFGNLTNLGIIATYLAQYYNVIQIDLRNHGHSPFDQVMNYTIMAQDILDLLDYLSIKKCILIGHSMGGKVAMTLSILASQRVTKIVIIDIAPSIYSINKYNNIFYTIDKINRLGIQNKDDATYLMQKNLINQHIISFLLKSFHKGKWYFNFKSIKKNYIYINDWTLDQCYQGPALFIKGELSSYINDLNIQKIYHQFPYAHVYTVPNSGHWVHYDNPVYLMNVINTFILN